MQNDVALVCLLLDVCVEVTVPERIWIARHRKLPNMLSVLVPCYRNVFRKCLKTASLIRFWTVCGRLFHEVGSLMAKVQEHNVPSRCRGTQHVTASGMLHAFGWKVAYSSNSCSYLSPNETPKMSVLLSGHSSLNCLLAQIHSEDMVSEVYETSEDILLCIICTDFSEFL